MVRAYLGYLRTEQEVVDDRVSRREVSAAYYRHNSNRIRALRMIAVRIARESQNDYLPEFEAVSREELRLLFEQPPKVENLRIDEVVSYTLRFLGALGPEKRSMYLPDLIRMNRRNCAKKTPNG